MSIAVGGSRLSGAYFTALFVPNPISTGNRSQNQSREMGQWSFPLAARETPTNGEVTLILKGGG